MTKNHFCLIQQFLQCTVCCQAGDLNTGAYASISFLELAALQGSIFVLEEKEHFLLLSTDLSGFTWQKWILGVISGPYS